MGAKIKNDPLYNDFNEGGLKIVNISKKIGVLKCSWIKKRDDESFHE